MFYVLALFIHSLKKLIYFYAHKTKVKSKLRSNKKGDHNSYAISLIFLTNVINKCLIVAIKCTRKKHTFILPKHYVNPAS